MSSSGIYLWDRQVLLNQLPINDLLNLFSKQIHAENLLTYLIEDLDASFALNMYMI